MQPIDYTIKTQNPNDMVMGGLKNAATIMDMQNAQQQAVDQQAMNQAKVAQMQQQQQQAQYQQQRFMEVAKNPTSANVRKLSVEFPQFSEQFTKVLAPMTQAEKDAFISSGSSVLFALEKGKPEVAKEMIDRELKAAENSNDEVAIFRLKNVKDSLVMSPDGARFAIKGLLMSAMGPKEYADTMKKLGEEERAQQEAPFDLKKKQSEAESAAVKAKFAESDAALDLQKKGWDIKAIQNDIDVKRQNVAIAAMNARTSAANGAASNSLKAQENQIKLAELIDKRNETVRGKAAELESARGSIDNLLNTTDKILKTPMGVVGSAAGPISSRLPTLSQSTADFEAMVENLDAQSFMAMIPQMKGTGALSDAEGKKLAASLQNFSLKQSPEQLMSSVKEAQRLMLKARKNLSEKYGVPDSRPDTPSVAPTGNNIEALLKKYGQ